MRKLITFDCDGVIAGDEYIDPTVENANQAYMELSMKANKDILYQITLANNVYVVSKRSFPRAVETTRDWLTMHGVNPGAFCGVICSPAKLSILMCMEPDLHFDDDPHVVRMLGEDKAVLVNNPQWPANQQATDLSRVWNWREIAALCGGAIKPNEYNLL